MKKTKYAFICHTNYTLLNCINIVLNGNGSFDADLYVEYMQDSMYQIIDNLKQMQIFANIYEDSLCNIRNQKKGKITHFIKKCLLYKSIRNKYYYLKYRFNIDRDIIDSIDYDAVFTSFLDYNSWHLMYISNNSKLHFYEEGISTYLTGIIGCDESAPGLMILKRLLNLSVYDFKIESIYLNCPEAYKLNEGYIIKKISFQNDEFTNELLTKVFYGDYTKYKSKHIIVLSQPTEEFYRSFQIVKNSLNGRNDYLIRLHQGEEENEYAGYNFTNDNLLWEMICGNYVNENTVLVGYNSTALITPKILHNKEPKIVFMFNLIGDTKGTTMSYKYYELLKDLYTDKNKVFLPKNYSEFIGAINNIH